MENDTHNGGTLRFAKDKTLYISYGEDQRPELVQSLSTYNGKILRINRDGTIPPDNPIFPNEPVDKKPEIFAIGLRNPFRFSLNLNDELFIGDVGAGAKEELNISNGGENYGWPRYEGTKDNDSLAILVDTVYLNNTCHCLAPSRVVSSEQYQMLSLIYCFLSNLVAG